MNTSLLEFTIHLQNQSFDGWSEEAINGYMTAINTIQEHIRNSANTTDWVYAEEDPAIHSDSIWLDEDFVH